jgi:diaminopropionate ammonia-lyase
VVEPEAAPALLAGIEAGQVVHAAGPVSNMGRLDCKEASLLALDCLSIEADAFMSLDDDFVAQTIRQLTAASLETSPSGGAGFAGLSAACRAQQLSIDRDSRALIYLSEGPTDS